MEEKIKKNKKRNEELNFKDCKKEEKSLRVVSRVIPAHGSSCQSNVFNS